MRGRSDFLWSEATLELVALHAIRGGTVGKPHPATSGRKRFVGREIGLGSAAKTASILQTAASGRPQTS